MFFVIRSYVNKLYYFIHPQVRTKQSYKGQRSMNIKLLFISIISSTFGIRVFSSALFFFKLIFIYFFSSENNIFYSEQQHSYSYYYIRYVISEKLYLDTQLPFFIKDSFYSKHEIILYYFHNTTNLRAWSIAEPYCWNSLPNTLRSSHFNQIIHKILKTRSCLNWHTTTNPPLLLLHQRVDCLLEVVLYRSRGNHVADSSWSK